MISYLSLATVTLFFVIVTALLVMALSFILDHIWAKSLRQPWLYIFLSAPGIVVHECAHIIGCLVSGAKIKKVVLLSKDGGKVSYVPPAIPVLGNVIINSAPLFIIPLLLVGMTWFFGTYAGCTFPSLVLIQYNPASMFSLVTTIGQTLYYNFITHFNGWFIFYLYLVTSLALSISPSTQDLKNSIVGIIFLILVGEGIILVNFPAVTYVILVLLNLVGTGLMMGLMFELIALFVSLPVIFTYWCSTIH
jgi:hypothetical protein